MSEPLARPPRRTPALLAAVATALVLVVLIYVGSRALRNFDAALIGYAVATVIAAAALAYRYTLWITKPPTWRYWRAGWANFFSWRNFARYTWLIPRAFWTDILAQTFILRRGFARWVMHMSIFWGVVISLLVTVPLSFGWIHFTLADPETYRAWVFGFPVATFPLDSFISWSAFHVLDYTSVLILLGLGIALWRRAQSAGLVTTQRFGFDLLPIFLLFAISVTGLALTASQVFWQGRFYTFISLSHQVVVVAWFFTLPYGKFFHIVQRPASIGVTLYQQVTQGVEHEGVGAGAAPAAPCRRCGEPLPSPRFVADLEASLHDLGMRFDLGPDGGELQDYCPTCKRRLRADAYYHAVGNRLI